MKNTIFVRALDEYIHGEQILDTEISTVKMNVIKRSKAYLSSNTNYEINILVLFKTNELNFNEIVSSVYKYIYQQSGKIQRITANWFICSDQGGIYLYEAIATHENRKYEKMHNRFLILNSDNGIASFGPGHIKNAIISDKFKSLLETYKSFPKQKWTNEIFDVFGICQQILNHQ